MGKAEGTPVMSDELVALVEGGAATWMATCDREGRPEATRVMGTRVSANRRTVVLYVPTEQAGATLENLRHNARLAVWYSRPTDYRAVQIKGVLVDQRPTNDEDAEHQARYTQDFATAAANVGVPIALTSSLRRSPAVAIEMTVDELFAQTPGPQAGAPWR